MSISMIPVVPPALTVPVTWFSVSGLAPVWPHVIIGSSCALKLPGLIVPEKDVTFVMWISWAVAPEGSKKAGGRARRDRPARGSERAIGAEPRPRTQVLRDRS